MDFAKLAAERYSLRKFSDRPVEAEKLAAVLESGRNAPTAHNFQPQRILVLQSPEALEKVDGCTGAHFHPPVMCWLWPMIPPFPGSGRPTERTTARSTLPSPPPR